MPSDRNTKAGNAGDVVKHPALVAALATVLQEHAPDRVVRYADAFAGFAPYTLPPRGGWCDGIRLLNLREIGAGPASRFVHRWASLFSSPPTAGDRYPGSTAIALETAAGLHREVLISAWDTSE